MDQKSIAVFLRLLVLYEKSWVKFLTMLIFTLGLVTHWTLRYSFWFLSHHSAYCHTHVLLCKYSLTYHITLDYRMARLSFNFFWSNINDKGWLKKTSLGEILFSLYLESGWSDRHTNFEDPITWTRDIRKTKFHFKWVFFDSPFNWMWHWLAIKGCTQTWKRA